MEQGAAPAGPVRQPGTRAAPGLRPPGHYEPAARSSLTEGANAPAKGGPGPVVSSREEMAIAAVERQAASVPHQGRLRRKARSGASLGAPPPLASHVGLARYAEKRREGNLLKPRAQRAASTNLYAVTVDEAQASVGRNERSALRRLDAEA
jgi:hypothetical protein